MKHPLCILLFVSGGNLLDHDCERGAMIQIRSQTNALFNIRVHVRTLLAITATDPSPISMIVLGSGVGVNWPLVKLY